MNESCKPIAIIPARGGSKRFPGKNIAQLGGKPLLAWSIEAARVSDIFDEVYVSSDDAAILKLAEEYGAVPHIRDKQLANDTTSVAEVCAEIGADLMTEPNPGKVPNPNRVIVALLPTSPFRSPATIRSAYDLFSEKNADALMSVSPLEHPPEWAMTVKDQLLKPCDPLSYNTPRNQLPQSVRGDGLIMMAKLAYLETHRSFVGPRTLAFSSPPGETVDIDEPADLLWAEFLLSRREN
ncbi:MAG TPA: acylneuraminate cytidylyltransferase family protein [Phycisphaerae bacterium]|nr:acylneuraminate cytidylyltransferase family protein [Phycisphaerae bacterium]